MKQLGTIRKRVRSADPVAASLLIAAATYAMALAAHAVLPSPALVEQIFLLTGAAALVVAFVRTYWAGLRKFWSHPVGKVVVSLAHIAVLFISTGWSREIVGLAVGLPPQDFEMTVALVSALMYFPVWCAAVVIVAGLAAVIHEVVALVLAMLGRPCWRQFGLIAGALVVLILSGSALDWSAQRTRLLTPLIRSTAYVFDFQPAPNLPGVLPHERIRVLANGSVAVARSLDDTISIELRSP